MSIKSTHSWSNNYVEQPTKGFPFTSIWILHLVAEIMSFKYRTSIQLLAHFQQIIKLSLFEAKSTMKDNWLTVEEIIALEFKLF